MNIRTVLPDVHSTYVLSWNPFKTTISCATLISIGSFLNNGSPTSCIQKLSKLIDDCIRAYSDYFHKFPTAVESPLVEPCWFGWSQHRVWSASRASTASASFTCIGTKWTRPVSILSVKRKVLMAASVWTFLFCFSLDLVYFAWIYLLWTGVFSSIHSELFYARHKMESVWVLRQVGAHVWTRKTFIVCSTDLHNFAIANDERIGTGEGWKGGDGGRGEAS